LEGDAEPSFNLSEQQPSFNGCGMASENVRSAMDKTCSRKAADAATISTSYLRQK
jgi:hypothetical protein